MALLEHDDEQKRCALLTEAVETAVHSYRCPVHGPVGIEVPRDAAPNETPCPLESWSVGMGDKRYASRAEAAEVALGAGYADPETAFYQSHACLKACTLIQPR